MQFHGCTRKFPAVPFDGVRFDREMQKIVKAEENELKWMFTRYDQSAGNSDIEWCVALPQSPLAAAWEAEDVRRKE